MKSLPKGPKEVTDKAEHEGLNTVLMVCSAALGSTVCRDVGNLLKEGLR